MSNGDKHMEEDTQLKQFIIVSKNLRMSSGKVASQVAHATFMVIEKQRNKQSELIKQWKKTGMCVIVLQCKDTTKLLGAQQYCKEWNIHYHLYVDEGFTEVEPMTPTAFATGVLTPEQQIFFSQFKLYKSSIVDMIIRRFLNFANKKS